MSPPLLSVEMDKSSWSLVADALFLIQVPPRRLVMASCSQRNDYRTHISSR